MSVARDRDLLPDPLVRMAPGRRIAGASGARSVRCGMRDIGRACAWRKAWRTSLAKPKLPGAAAETYRDGAGRACSATYTASFGPAYRAKVICESGRPERVRAAC